MNWDICSKKIQFYELETVSSCHNCTIFICVPKYLTVAQFLAKLVSHFSGRGNYLYLFEPPAITATYNRIFQKKLHLNNGEHNSSSS